MKSEQPGTAAPEAEHRNSQSAPPSISLIIPCFNDGATVIEAVHSARLQRRVGELIVVDDGSTEEATHEAMLALEADGVSVLRRRNGGLAAARMSGVEASSSEYVFALDADDRLFSGAVDALADMLDRDRTQMLAWGDYQLFGDRSYRQETARELDPWQITYQNDLPSSTLIRRSALLAAGGWRKSGGYEDWDLWMSLAELSAPGRRIELPVYEYRQHGVRMLSDASARHGALYAELRARHRSLFEQRRAAWRSSRAPLGLRLALPAIDALPIDVDQKRLLGGAACHLAHRRGARLLVRRARGG